MLIKGLAKCLVHNPQSTTAPCAVLVRQGGRVFQSQLQDAESEAWWFQRIVSVRDKNLGHLTQKSRTLSSRPPCWVLP